MLRNALSVEGSWESWGSWSACSDTCGVGTRVRSRVHNAGLPCSGGPTHTENCQSKVFFSLQLHCSVVKVMCYFLVEGAWMSWEPWGTCSTSCGQGTKSRSRGHSAGLPCTGSDTNVGNCQSEVNYFLPRSDLFNQSV